MSSDEPASPDAGIDHVHGASEAAAPPPQQSAGEKRRAVGDSGCAAGRPAGHHWR